jgi:hypothetical protein
MAGSVTNWLWANALAATGRYGLKFSFGSKTDQAKVAVVSEPQLALRS